MCPTASACSAVSISRGSGNLLVVREGIAHPALRLDGQQPPVDEPAHRVSPKLLPSLRRIQRLLKQHLQQQRQPP